MTLEELLAKREPVSPGCNPGQFIELYGGKQIELINYEPDPNTYREEYYYNSYRNVLYRKIKATDPKTGTVKNHWKRVSQY